MSYKMYLFQHPVFWLFLSGAFLGGAAAVLTVVSDRTRDPEKTARRRPTKVFLFLTGAVLSGTIAVFASAGKFPFAPRFLYASAAGFLIAGLGLRFRKTAGILILALAGVLVFAGPRALSGWIPVAGPEPVGTIKVLHLGQNGVSLLLSNERGEERVVRLPAPDFSLTVDILRLDELYVFAGGNLFYRLSSISSGGEVRPLGEGVPASRYGELLLRLPGVRTDSVPAVSPSVELFSSYAIIVDSKGNPRITEK